MSIITTQGRNLILQKIVNKVEAQDFVLHLYINDYTPKKSSTIFDFQEMPEDKGYMYRTMWGLFWELNAGKVQAVEEVFIFTGKVGKVRGWFITEGDVVIWAEKFKEAFDGKRTGDKLKLNFRIGIK